MGVTRGKTKTLVRFDQNCSDLLRFGQTVGDWNIGIMERWNDGGRTIPQSATHLQICAKLCKFMQSEADGTYELGESVEARLPAVTRDYPRSSAVTRGGNTRT